MTTREAIRNAKAAVTTHEDAAIQFRLRCSASRAAARLRMSDLAQRIGRAGPSCIAQFENGYVQSIGVPLLLQYVLLAQQTGHDANWLLATHTQAARPGDDRAVKDAAATDMEVQP